MPKTYVFVEKKCNKYIKFPKEKLLQIKCYTFVKTKKKYPKNSLKKMAIKYLQTDAAAAWNKWKNLTNRCDVC